MVSFTFFFKKSQLRSTCCLSAPLLLPGCEKINRFCQVLRLVLDPDMLLQLAKKSAVTSSATGAGAGGRGERGRERRQQQQLQKPRSPYSHVDAWKSINGRPFARWVDPSVDVWDSRFEEGGPPNAEWLELPPLAAELDRAAGVMEVGLRAVLGGRANHESETRFEDFFQYSCGSFSFNRKLLPWL